MRSTDDYEENTASFLEDLPEGGMLLQCRCGAKFIEPPGWILCDNASWVEAPNHGKEKICDHCFKEIFYPSWASW